VRALLQRLDHWLATKRPRYARGLLPGADRSELISLEKKVGLPIPADLAVLLAWHNGQNDDFVGHLEGDWDLMSLAEMVDVKAEMDPAAGQGGWQRAWIPFLKDDSDDYVLLDTSQPGAPVREFWQGNPDHSIVAPSLKTWLEDFVRALEHGEYVEDPERGTMLRRNKADRS
jgi:cell wall assembly regulator SMI1